jgi:chromate transport protein ChrA
VLSAVLIGFVVFAVSMKLSPVWVVIAAFLVGWVGGEANALRARLYQWDTFSRYLDWARIEQDIKDGT